MASSKDGAKPRKIVDVSAPGKAAPPATSRPIIVTNRPMIRRDPMMTPTDTPSDMPEVDRSISRVAKTIKVIPADATEPAADEAKAAPVEEAKPAEVTPIAPEPGQIDAKPTTIKHVDHEVALEIGEEALESLEEGIEKPAGVRPNEAKPEPGTAMPVVPIVDSSSEGEMIADPEGPTRIAVSVPAPTKDEAVVVPVTVDEPTKIAAAEKPKSESSKSEEKPAGEPVAIVVTDATDEKANATTEELAEPETPETTTTDTTEDAAKAEGTASEFVTPPTVEPTSAPDLGDGDTTDEQLPASQVLEDEQRKKDEEAAQLLAEQEKIIASKRYYLPIKSRTRRRGIARAVVALVLVILLSLIWLDVVLDAGIVHIGGLHALTHFF